MKKIYVPNKSKQKLGGGFVFIDNFQKGSQGKATFVNTWQESDVVFIIGATMTPRDEIVEAKKAGKKIVFRIDNMPKDSRNRGTAFSRMKDYSVLADAIIFQSEWAKEYVGHWAEFNFKVDLNKSKVIYNGVDVDCFYYRDNPKDRDEVYLFCTFNTDENKRFPEAAYDFHLRHFKALREKTPLPLLKLVGNISGSSEYNFDFFNGEKFNYSPPIADRKGLANVYRSCKYLYFPAFADASPNTVSEAIACGCEVLLVNPVGGTKEVVEKFSHHIITIQENADQYLEMM